MSNSKFEPVEIAFALPHRPSPKSPDVVFGPSMTEQCHQESCDINNIVSASFANPMLLADPNPDRKVFRDFSSGDNYLELQNQLCEAQSMFNSLSSEIREAFDHDPAKVIDFVSNPDNALESHQMGLITLDKIALDTLQAENDLLDKQDVKTPSEPKPPASEA